MTPFTYDFERWEERVQIVPPRDRTIHEVAEGLRRIKNDRGDLVTIGEHYAPLLDDLQAEDYFVHLQLDSPSSTAIDISCIARAEIWRASAPSDKARLRRPQGGWTNEFEVVLLSLALKAVKDRNLRPELRTFLSSVGLRRLSGKTDRRALRYRTRAKHMQKAPLSEGVTAGQLDPVHPFFNQRGADPCYVEPVHIVRSEGVNDAGGGLYWLWSGVRVRAEHENGSSPESWNWPREAELLSRSPITAADFNARVTSILVRTLWRPGADPAEIADVTARFVSPKCVVEDLGGPRSCHRGPDGLAKIATFLRETTVGHGFDASITATSREASAEWDDYRQFSQFGFRPNEVVRSCGNSVLIFENKLIVGGRERYPRSAFPSDLVYLRDHPILWHGWPLAPHH